MPFWLCTISRTAAANMLCVARSYCGFVTLCGKFGRGFTPAGLMVGRMETGTENLVKRSNTIFTFQENSQEIRCGVTYSSAQLPHKHVFRHLRFVRSDAGFWSSGVAYVVYCRWKRTVRSVPRSIVPYLVKQSADRPWCSLHDVVSHLRIERNS